MTRSEQGLPPAILLGSDMPMGLAVIRELGEHGVQVHAVANSRKGVGQYSKWAATRHIRPPSDEATIQLLNEISERHDAPFLLVVSESDLVMGRAAQDGGRLRTLRALIPEARQLAIVQDKSATNDERGVSVCLCPSHGNRSPGPNLRRLHRFWSFRASLNGRMRKRRIRLCPASA